MIGLWFHLSNPCPVGKFDSHIEQFIYQQLNRGPTKFARSSTAGANKNASNDPKICIFVTSKIQGKYAYG